uniref:Kielin cysteine rich BMP regulator n=1 Tax=Hucho hucho TaxID=62062 RepID=A0A4W5K2T8_9TELE
MSRPLKGISKVQGEGPGTQAYKLRPRSPHLTLTKQYSHYLVSSLQGSLGIHLMGRQGADSSGTLLSFSSSSSSSPLLQLYSSTRSKSLRLDHQAGSEGQGLASVLFPGGSPFSGGGWVRLALALEAGRVSLFVDCREAVVIQRDKEERVKLQLPPDLVITLASTQGDIESKFTGYVQTAEISTRAYQRRPWHCDNITDRVDSGPGLEPQQDIANYQPHNPSLHPHHPQGDQPQRGGVLLGPPAPHGVKPVSQSQGEDRLRGLEERLEGLERMLDMVKAQNVDLQARVQYLEDCECVRRGCVWEGRQVEEGHRWETHQNTFCTCTSGQVTCSASTDGRYRTGSMVCSPPSCPPLDCSEQETLHGECCPRCRGLYNSYTLTEEIMNVLLLQINFLTFNFCQGGVVKCETERCSPPCRNPSSPPPNTCCPVCHGCGMNGQDFLNGAQVPSVDRCQECVCMNGDIHCSPRPCPAVSCPNSVRRPGDCCPRCEQCKYDSQVLMFPSRTDPCLRCHCSAGEVSCERMDASCPPLRCSHPAKPRGQCCPTCDQCEYERRVYVNGNVFNPAGSGPCVQCSCKGGNVRCQEERCPPVQCSNPINDPQFCCPICKVCVLEGLKYEEGSQWQAEGCSTCTCLNGEVVCTHTHCPPTACTHPTKTTGLCCAECERCTFDQRIYSNRQTFTHPDQPCHTCTCLEGTVQCVRRACPPLNCSNTHTPHGECCPKCPDCSFENRVFVDGEVFPSPVSVCEECLCVSGRVDCHASECPRPHCTTPLPGTCCQNNCNGCSYAGKEYPNGQEFPHPTDNCRTCHCINGNVQCLMRRCPPLGCSNPILLPEECCPQCPVPPADCVFEGRPYRHTERFYDPTDPCRSCLCTNGTSRCQRKPCPLAHCSHPIQQECCRTCDGTRLHTSWGDVSDPCGVCVCREGSVHCERKRCPADCTHPYKPPGQCCGECNRMCLYQGEEFQSGASFTPPIDPSNPCQRCTCVRGSVTCMPLFCPPTSCPQPITLPGDCCPQCAVCVYQGEEYSDLQQWNPSSNLCTACTCQAGKVQCVGPECPKLTCMHQLTEPGTCCPRCRGCVYDGEEHAEASSWFADSTPCMSCMCVDGVTTCSEVRCLTPCINTVTVPGECCPVCADCVFEGRVYGPGDSFHPADDPCHICTCEVMPDGEQHLRCYHKQCPSLVDCVKSNILFSGPDSCCPVCAQPLSNCTDTLIGNEVLATDDPCFTCQCKDLTWTCLHQSCPPLSCRHEEHHTHPDSCCPVCDECVIEGEKRRVSNGESWTDSEDECVTCTCNLGYIECSIEECVPVECEQGLVRMKTPGKCCYECQDSGVQCVYQGSVYQSNEQWEVDECTSCTCVFGDVHCYSQRCPPLGCAADETPAVIPGVCCPHCIPRPATCVAFGDPHYRTFDGRMLHFQGACTYILSQDCDGGDFSIHATNDDRGRKGVSWTKEVTVFIGDVVVQLLQDWVVRVDYKVVTLPFLKEPYIYLERQTNTILLNTNIGLKVLWSGRSHLEVSIPGSYKGHTCGLCGNFNNYPQDDLRTPAGKVSQSEADFGNSWKVSSGNSSLSCQPGEDIDPCKAAGYQARKSANARCRVLKSAVFQACHHLVAPEPWYAACVYDLCACGANADECLCDALEAYAAQCREAGARLSWRSSSLCAVGCPVERGFVFDECGPPCPVTCLNRDVPLGVIESHCFKPCVPGCQCPAGLVLHNNHCVPPETCPKIIHGKS